MDWIGPMLHFLCWHYFFKKTVIDSQSVLLPDQSELFLEVSEIEIFLLICYMTWNINNFDLLSKTNHLWSKNKKCLRSVSFDESSNPQVCYFSWAGVIWRCHRSFTHIYHDCINNKCSHKRWRWNANNANRGGTQWREQTEFFLNQKTFFV